MAYIEPMHRNKPNKPNPEYFMYVIWIWYSHWPYHEHYCQISNISHTLIGHEIVHHSDVVGASPVGAAPTTSSFST